MSLINDFSEINILKKNIQKQNSSILHRVTLEISFGCNQHCLHCYKDAGPDLLLNDRKGFRNYPLILQRLRDFGFYELKLTGGEPLLYPSLKELLSEAQQLGFHVSLISGGSAGTKEQWHYLGHSLEHIWFSLCHIEASIHDNLVQREGALNSLWRHFDLISEYKVKRGVYLLLNSYLIDDLKRILTYLCRRGVHAIKILWPSPQGAALRNWSKYSISILRWPDVQETASHVSQKYPEVKISLARHAIHNGKLFKKALKQDYRLSCNYGDSNVWGVDPEGLLYPCCLLTNNANYAIGHVLDLSFREVKRRLAGFVLRDLQRNPPVGPLSGTGFCPAMLNSSGQDLRFNKGSSPVCPLFQISI